MLSNRFLHSFFVGVLSWQITLLDKSSQHFLRAPHASVEPAVCVVGLIFGAAAVGAMKNAPLETDLTDAQWDHLQLMLPKPKKHARKPIDRRAAVDAILYRLKGRGSCRLLPKNFPPQGLPFFLGKTNH